MRYLQFVSILHCAKDALQRAEDASAAFLADKRAGNYVREQVSIAAAFVARAGRALEFGLDGDSEKEPK